MTATKSLIFLFLGASLFNVCRASVSMDENYAFRNICAVVVNTADEPVQGEQVEAALGQLIRDNPRFEYSNEGLLLVKGKMRGLPPISLHEITAEKLKPLEPALV